MAENDKPIIVEVSGERNATDRLDDPDDARYITVDTDKQKSYLDWLVEKDRYSLKGLRTKLTGMKLYEKWLRNSEYSLSKQVSEGEQQ